MSLYFDTTYPKDEKNEYPQEYVNYMYNRFFKKGGYILDAGCANGKFLSLLKNKNLTRYGIDLREEKLVDKSIIFKQGDLNSRLPYPEDFFDFVYTKSVISMLWDTSFFFQEVRRILKPGGKFICLIPDWKSNYKWYWDDFTYSRAFTRKGLREGLSINGFKNEDCEYFYQLPFVWENPKLIWLCKLIAEVVPDRFKFKDREQRNTKDRKLVRFSKERMLLAYGEK